MIIFDNTFSDPFAIRSCALKQEYTRSNLDYYPGFRGDVPEFISSQYRRIVSSRVNEDLKIKSINFYYCDESWLEGACHYDDSKYTCLTFLNPASRPHTGIEIYDEKYSNEKYHRIKDDFSPDRIKYYTSGKNFFRKKRFGSKLRKYNSNFEDPCIAANKFNRTVFFDSHLYHRPQDYFGNDVSNSRLILISFFI